MERILDAFLADAAVAPALQAFARNRDITTAYHLTDQPLTFHLRFAHGEVTGGLGDPPEPAQVALKMGAATLDGMLSGRLNPTRATLAGEIVFEGDARTALTIQRVQKELIRLYAAARTCILSDA